MTVVSRSFILHIACIVCVWLLRELGDNSYAAPGGSLSGQILKPDLYCHVCKVQCTGGQVT